MKYRNHIARAFGASLAAAAMVAGTGVAAQAASATIVSYVNFNGATKLSLNGSAVLVSPAVGSPRALRLTANKKSQRGAAWAPVQTDPTKSFLTTFTVQMKHSTVAGDGIAFVLQGTGKKIVGGVGGGLGYSGIKPSLAVEFDTFANPFDMNANHIDVVTGGNSEVSNIAARAPLAMAGSTFKVTIAYEAKAHSMKVWVNSAAKPGMGALTINKKVDVAAAVGTAPVNVGFTGATGSAFATQDILDWTMSNG